MNILDQIVEKHKEDLSQRGIDLGYTIPEKRSRVVVPFLKNKGVILEVKRASPSKGDIAPNLDSAKTALSYVDGGAAAISVLTEEHWFKGGLDDLIKVASAVENRAAVLRKDFLLEEEEIDVAYRCGADAVLLIARILDDKKIVSMAQKCQSLGITALVELKMDDDLRKLNLVAQAVDKKFIVCGVNCRDLKNFSINLLTPSAILNEIKSIMGEDARVVFESGIRTPQSADFAGSLGFTGMLLGEAAARNPSEAKKLVEGFINGKENPHSKFWTNIAVELRKKEKENIKKPLIKICGLTNFEDANISAKCGADFLGFIFCSKSPRNVYEKISDFKNQLTEIKKSTKAKTVAVITEMNSNESDLAFKLFDENIFDVIQLHGFDVAMDFLSKDENRHIPHYCVVPINCEDDLQKLEELRKLGEPRILVDTKIEGLLGGTGIQIDGDLVQKISSKQKLWLAGGLNPNNIEEIIQKYDAELLDISSGLEIEKGKKDSKKIEMLFEKLNGGQK